MKLAFLGLALFGLIGLSLQRADETILADAERSFSEGVKARNDAETARKHFSRAAQDYDELWRNGHRNPALARNRARAHRSPGTCLRQLPHFTRVSPSLVTIARFRSNSRMPVRQSATRTTTSPNSAAPGRSAASAPACPHSKPTSPLAASG